MKTLAVIKYLFFLAGAAMLFGAGALVHTTREFVAQADRVQGTVMAMAPGRGSRGAGLSSPVVAFRAADGRMIEWQSSVATNPPAHAVGDSVTVLYRRDAPEDARLEGFLSLWSVPSLVGGLGSMFFLTGLAMIVVPLRSNRRARLLAATGIPVQAKVQDIERDVLVEVNGRHPWRIVARWKDPVTAEYRVFRSQNLWQDPAEHLQSDYVTVFLDGNNPRRYHMETRFGAG